MGEVMKYEEFKSYMERIVQFLKFEDDLYHAFSSTGGECYIGVSGIDIAIDLLNKIFFEEEDSLIDYWVYELDCGKSWEAGCLTNKDGADIRLETISDLYDELIRNVAEKKGE